MRDANPKSGPEQTKNIMAVYQCISQAIWNSYITP